MSANSAFYAGLEDGVREMVSLLRNAGINTEDSCHHKGYIQCQTLDPTEEIRVIKSVLYERGIDDYTIEVFHKGMNEASHLTIRSMAFMKGV